MLELFLNDPKPTQESSVEVKVEMKARMSNNKKLLLELIKNKLQMDERGINNTDR